MSFSKTDSKASDSYGATNATSALSPEEDQPDVLPLPPVDKDDGRLHRGLSARQVQMIAIAGTIGTGLFLGTGSSLARGGPASMLICYTIIGFIVYVTLLLLGEMATQYPVAGSFGTYCTRFFSPSYGFALAWNYWFNDAVSVAGDLTAAQLVMSYWTDWHPWAIGVIFWVFLVGINAVHVRAYGELGGLTVVLLYAPGVIDGLTHRLTEYWLASLKVIAIIVFIILGILVNVGVNQEHRYIGGENWRIPGAPFVGGFGGFARVFVTASFACTHLKLMLALCICLSHDVRWWDGESGHHCRGDEKPVKEYAEGSQVRILEVRLSLVSWKGDNILISPSESSSSILLAFC